MWVNTFHWLKCSFVIVGVKLQAIKIVQFIWSKIYLIFLSGSLAILESQQKCHQWLQNAGYLFGVLAAASANTYRSTVNWAIRNKLHWNCNKNTNIFIEQNVFQMLFAKCRQFGLGLSVLTHWGRVTHICVGNLAIIGSDNGLSPGRRQAIIWTSAGILLIRPLGTNFSELLIGIQTFSFRKMHLKMSSYISLILVDGIWPRCVDFVSGICNHLRVWSVPLAASPINMMYIVLWSKVTKNKLELATTQHWLRKWLGVVYSTRHYPKKWRVN